MEIISVKDWWESEQKGIKHLSGTEHDHDQSTHSPKNMRETIMDGKERKLANGDPLPKHLSKGRIPPAWTDVIVNIDPKESLWVKGSDSKERSQSIYNPKFTEQNAHAKFARIKELSRKFEQIQRENEKYMMKGETREQASCLSLIIATGIRPGRDRDTGADKKAYGATTLRKEHVVKDNGNVILKFTGKKGVDISIPVVDKNIAKMLTERERKTKEGGKLFDTNDNKLRDYVKELNGKGFKPTNFRTFLGTKTALDMVVSSVKKPNNQKEYKKMVKQVAIAVSAKLGNTPTIALQSYINPIVFSEWKNF